MYSCLTNLCKNLHCSVAWVEMISFVFIICEEIYAFSGTDSGWKSKNNEKQTNSVYSFGFVFSDNNTLKSFPLLIVLILTYNTVSQVYLCGNNADAKQAVAEVATKMGLTVLDRGSLEAARELEDFPLQLFPEWRLPLVVGFGLTTFFFLYLLIRDTIYAYVVQGRDVSYRIMVSLPNKVRIRPCLLGPPLIGTAY